jgi:N-acetylmuramoyl-L-alanine amidase CwlA
MRPEDFCPICGKYTHKDYSGHRCPEKVLRAIDGARNIDEKDSEANRKSVEPPYGDKLKFGFEIINGF